jgi:hypothetical protein
MGYASDFKEIDLHSNPFIFQVDMIQSKLLDETRATKTIDNPAKGVYLLESIERQVQLWIIQLFRNIDQHKAGPSNPPGTRPRNPNIEPVGTTIDPMEQSETSGTQDDISPKSSTIIVECPVPPVLSMKDPVQDFLGKVDNLNECSEIIFRFADIL